jgi:hypothetical protein
VSTVEPHPLALRKWGMALVRFRHPLLLAVVISQTWRERQGIDWSLLQHGAQMVTSPSAGSLYHIDPGIQAGPPVFIVVRLLDILPGNWGLNVAYILLALLGWLLLFLAERWTVKGAKFFSAPEGPGLLTLAVGLPVLLAWVALSAHAPHLEDGFAVLCAILALRAVTQNRGLLAALLVGFAVAWKPWAVGAIPLLWGLKRHRIAMLVVAVAVPAAFWLPFLLWDPQNFGAMSYAFPIQPESPLRLLGVTGVNVPSWGRTLEIGGALLVASIAAFRRDWRVAFAAGCATRLLLDAAGYDYYMAGLIMVTAVTERLSGLRPWRTCVLLLGLVYVDALVASRYHSTIRFEVLVVVIVSWLHPWRSPAVFRRLSRRAVLPGGSAASSELVPAPRSHLGTASDERVMTVSASRPPDA